MTRRGFTVKNSVAPPTCACLPLGAGYKRWRPTDSPEAHFHCLRLATYYFTFIYFKSSPVYEVTQRTLTVTDVSGQRVGPLLKRQTVQKEFILLFTECISLQTTQFCN